MSAGDRLVFRLAQTAGAATTGDPTDDQFTVTLLDQIDHLPNVPANDDSQTLSLDLSGAFLATDKDNDSIQLTSAVTVVVEDDIPVNTATLPVSVSVQEDALNNFDGSVASDNLEGSTGNNEGGKTTTAVITYAMLAPMVTVGADEQATFSLNLAAFGGAGSIVGTLLANGNPLDVEGQAVEFGIDAGTIIGYVDNDSNNALQRGRPSGVQAGADGGRGHDGRSDRRSVHGHVAPTQIDHLPNVPANDDSQTLSLDLSGAFLATDKDNDSIQLTSGGDGRC